MTTTHRLCTLTMDHKGDHGDPTGRRDDGSGERMAVEMTEATGQPTPACGMPILSARDCLDWPSPGCTGRVEYRESLSGTGTPIPRCDGHWRKRLDQHAEHRRNYPDSDTPPAWFDEANAGERWNDDY